MHDYIIHHKIKIAILTCGILTLLILLYFSQIGFKSHSVPTFANETLKIEDVEYINIKYGIGKTMTFHNTKMKFTLDSNTTLDISGDFTIATSLFAMVSNNIKHAHIKIKNANITVIQNQPTYTIQSTIMKIITSDSSTFSDIRFFDTQVTVLDIKGNKTDSFTLSDFTMQNLPHQTTASGIVKIGEQTINVSYIHGKDDATVENKNNIKLTVKSHIFDLSLIGKQKTYGTASKESTLNGDVEIVIRNPEQFASLVTHSENLPKYFAGLQRLSMKGQLEYASSGHLIKINNGKIDFMGSLGDFEFVTIDANKRYKAIVNFNSMSFAKITEYFQSLKFLTEEEVSQKNVQYKRKISQESINLFSIIGPSHILEIDLTSKQIASGDTTFFKDVQSNVRITSNKLAITDFNATANKLQINGNGAFTDLNTKHPSGLFAIKIHGTNDKNSIAKSFLKFFTNIKLQKTLTNETIDAGFNIAFKSPSIIFDTIHLDIQDTLNMNGNLQFTENFQNSARSTSQFRNITLSNINLSDFNLQTLNVNKSDTVFQKVMGAKKAYIETNYHIRNATLGKNIIKNASIETIMHKGNFSIIANVTSDKYTLHNNIAIQIANQHPIFNANIVLNNVTNFSELRNNISELFQDKHIFLPKLDKFKGHTNIAVYNSMLLGELVPKMHIKGNITSGVMEFANMKFSAKPNANKTPLSGKVSGKVDFNYHSPSFNLQLAFINAHTKEFQKILPKLPYNFEGTISGGGGFVFSGISYKEFLNSLQMNTKFVLQKTKIPKLNLNFLAKHLLATHGHDIFKFDKKYIESNLSDNQETLYNIIFSIAGKNRQFTIDSCNIKTSYTAGVCAGKLLFLKDGEFSFETMTKFAIPALDINSDLKEVMKLYISSKEKYNSSTKEGDISTNLSQIYQYINYRRATYGI